MSQGRLLHKFLKNSLPNIHLSRLNALYTIVQPLVNGAHLTITSIGRGIQNGVSAKHNIKKVDRLCSNHHLLKETTEIYTHLSRYILNRLPKEQAIVVDVCFIKDHHELQTIRASIAIQGRSITLFDYCYSKEEMKKSHYLFLSKLRSIIPADRHVFILMDAGFQSVWLKQLNKHNFDWIVRVRKGSGKIYLKAKNRWYNPKILFNDIKQRKDFGDILLSKSHRVVARLVGYRRKLKGRIKKNYYGRRVRRRESKEYSRYFREPWLLATSLPKDKYSAEKIARMYEKRMQIEESFRDLKSHQFGLGARYSKTKGVARWTVLLLLANLALFLLWLVGRYAYKKKLHRGYQSNTRYNRKEFSECRLGLLILNSKNTLQQNRLIANAWRAF